MKSLNSIAILTCSVVLLAACSGSKPTGQSESPSNKPAWFKPDPKTAGVIFRQSHVFRKGSVGEKD